jgi:sugar phosphate isomerase/epimerase
MPTHQLLFGFTLWGLEGLHSPREEGLAAVAGAGYSVVEGDIWAWENDDLCRRCEALNLRPSVMCFPMTADDLKPALQRACDIGAVQVNAHAATPHMDEDASVRLINEMYDEAERLGVRLLLETHRGRITQDLYRTARLCERVPRVRFNLDVSHYVVCEERPGPTAELAPLLTPIMDRAEMIHGRVSNGEQIQVDVGDGSGELPQLHAAFWAETMRRWRLRSRPGTALIFIPELGPVPYALRDAAGREISNRWEQSLVLRALAQNAWKLSAQSASPLWPVKHAPQHG